MELVLTTQELEPFPIRNLEYVKPGGLLNSKYQNVVNETLSKTSPNSVFGIRQRVRRRHFQFITSIETILKLSVFLIVLAVIF